MSLNQSKSQTLVALFAGWRSRCHKGVLPGLYLSESTSLDAL